MTNDIKKSAEMLEANAKLKHYITEAPAPQSKHIEALNWLNSIHAHYQKLLTQANGTDTET